MKFKDILKETGWFVIGVVIVLILIAMNIATSIGVDRLTSKEKDPEPPTIYDSPSKILEEDECTCPECGEISWGINGNVVCRNENCPNYGLAVPVDSRDQQAIL